MYYHELPSQNGIFITILNTCNFIFSKKYLLDVFNKKIETILANKENIFSLKF